MAATVPEFFHCLVGFSWCRGKFYFLHVWMNHKLEISSKKINKYRPLYDNCLIRQFGLKSESHLPKTFFFICFDDSSSKMMKNAFYFILKDLFVLKIFKISSWLFGHDLIRKVNFEIYDITAWLTKKYNSHIAQYLTN